MPHSKILVGYLLVALLGGCRGPEAEVEPEPGAPPVVGKLQFQDRVVDLTLEAFSDDPKAGVPRNARATVMADIIVDKREDKTQRPR